MSPVRLLTFAANHPSTFLLYRMFGLLDELSWARGSFPVKPGYRDHHQTMKPPVQVSQLRRRRLDAALEIGGFRARDNEDLAAQEPPLLAEANSGALYPGQLSGGVTQAVRQGFQLTSVHQGWGFVHEIGHHLPNVVPAVAHDLQRYERGCRRISPPEAEPDQENSPNGCRF